MKTLFNSGVHKKEEDFDSLWKKACFFSEGRALQYKMHHFLKTNCERASIKKPESVDITMIGWCCYRYRATATATAIAAAAFTLQMDFFCRASEFDYSDECRSTCTTFAPPPQPRGWLAGFLGENSNFDYPHPETSRILTKPVLSSRFFTF